MTLDHHLRSRMIKSRCLQSIRERRSRLYRRQMKAISYLGKIDKRLGVSVTTRNWNTIEKVAKILSQD
jgi:hypothetical protein